MRMIPQSWRSLWRVVVLSLCVAGCGKNVVAPVPPAANPDWTIGISFAYDFTNFPKCSATVTKGCISGFTWGYMQGATAVPLKTSAPSVCSGTSQPQSCADSANGIVGIGNIVPYAIANGVDNNGAAVASGQTNGPAVPVNIGAVTNVGITLQ